MEPPPAPPPPVVPLPKTQLPETIAPLSTAPPPDTAAPSLSAAAACSGCAVAVKRAAQLEALARHLAEANKKLIEEGRQRDTKQASIDKAVAGVQARLGELSASAAASEAENGALRERLALAQRSAELLQKRADAEAQRASLEAELSAAVRAESEALRVNFGSKLEALETSFNREVEAVRAGAEAREGALDAALRESQAREVRLRAQLEEFAPQVKELSDKFNETLEARKREAEAVRGRRPFHVSSGGWRRRRFNTPFFSRTPRAGCPAGKGRCRGGERAAEKHGGGVDGVPAWTNRCAAGACGAAGGAQKSSGTDAGARKAM